MLRNLGLARNLALPALPFWMARSFYAQLLLVLTVLANTAGIDLMGYFGAMGLGSTHDEVLANGDKFVSAWQQIAPLVFGFWAWIERRAPNHRISVPKNTIVPMVGILAFGLFAVLSPGAARAGIGEAVCMPVSEYRAMLGDRYGEVKAWTGQSASYTVELMVAPTGGWTLLMVDDDGKACNLTGGNASIHHRQRGVPV